MRAMRKRPGEAWEAIEVENELKPLQQAVGGYLESFTFAEDACVLCDEEGLLKGKPYNTTVCGGALRRYHPDCRRGRGGLRRPDGTAGGEAAGHGDPAVVAERG